MVSNKTKIVTVLIQCNFGFTINVDMRTFRKFNLKSNFFTLVKIPEKLHNKVCSSDKLYFTFRSQ